jgi:3-isopropylmalate/(R)-2-methylmalate dehydratase small subunit
VLPIVLDAVIVQSLADEIEMSQGAGRVTVDLAECALVSPAGVRHSFAIDPRRRTALLEGLDDIGLTLRRESEIAAFQARDRERRPWIHFAGDMA